MLFARLHPNKRNMSYKKSDRNMPELQALVEISGLYLEQVAELLLKSLPEVVCST